MPHGIRDTPIALLYRALTENIAGPDESTTRKKWNAARYHYRPGINAATFTYLAGVYARCRAKLPYKGKVLCEASEDETNIEASAHWCARRDAVTGTCGVENGKAHE